MAAKISVFNGPWIVRRNSDGRTLCRDKLWRSEPNYGDRPGCAKEYRNWRNAPRFNRHERGGVVAVSLQFDEVDREHNFQSMRMRTVN